jgi:sugar lactone lactonase YvrE
MAVVADSAGRIYVADAGAGIYLFDLVQKKVIVQEQGFGGSPITPVSLALGNPDTLYVIDSQLHRVLIYDSGLNPLSELSDDFQRPAGIAFDPLSGDLFVTDAGRNLIYRYGTTGKLVAVIGETGEASGGYNVPTHIWVDSSDVYITDSFNFQIKRINRAGMVASVYGHVGQVTGALARPKGIATDRAGHIYVVDALFCNVQIFDKSGKLLLFFGEPGGMGAAEFCLPNGIFIGRDEKIYIADTYHSRIQVFQYLHQTEELE